MFHCRSAKPERKSPISPGQADGRVSGRGTGQLSPALSVGPPQSPPANPYTNLFNSGLYQQYLGQLLANSSASGHAPMNPMLLQAQLAMAASNPLLSAINNPTANLISERLKQNRFSPYSLVSPPTSSVSPLTSGLASAFKALGGGGGSRPAPCVSPPVSPPHSSSPAPSLAISPGSGSVKSEPEPEKVSPGSEPGCRSDIKNIENMINGLNGTNEGRFGLSHSGTAEPARIS